MGLFKRDNEKKNESALLEILSFQAIELLTKIETCSKTIMKLHFSLGEGGFS
jgi:hypothetical protein